jgi:protein O-mannosyl-transferase
MMNSTAIIPALRTAASRRATLLSGVALAAALVYLNSLWNGFALDDVHIIERNSRVHNLGALRDIWLTPYWPYFGGELGLWRPFAIFGYAVQWAAAGGAPWLFHAVSILLHVIATVLVFLLLERLTDRYAALAGTLIFAVHPVHTEAVANIVGQAELIVAIGLLGACLVHVTRPPGLHVSWPRRLLLLGFFSMALYTKENAVVLPGLLLALDLAQRRIPLSMPGAVAWIRAVTMPLFLLGASLALYLVLRFEVLGGALTGVDAGPDFPFLKEQYRILNGVRAFPEFMRLLVFPLELAADYAPAMILPVESITPMTAVGGVILLGLAALALLTPWRPGLGLPAAWFLVTISTVSNLFFPIGVLIAERTLYLPSVALSAAIAYAWHSGAPAATFPARRAAAGLLILVVVLMGFRTWVRNPDWKSTRTVIDSLIRDHPSSYKAQWSYAEVQAAHGNRDIARIHFELAYRIYPYSSQMMMEYARFALNDGDYDKAIELLQRANAIHDYVPFANALLAYAYLHAGRFDEALDATVRAERLGIDIATFLALRGYAYEGLRRPRAAVDAWRRVVQSATANVHLARALLARALVLDARIDEAWVVLQDAIAAAADDEPALDLLRATGDAIRDGCYDAPHGAPPAPDATSCDPIPDFFRGLGGRQNARSLHNATIQPEERPLAPL